MKKLLFSFLTMLCVVTAWGADGDTFTANTVEGISLNFQVISETNKTCRAGYTISKTGSEWSVKMATNGLVTGTLTIPEKAAGRYKVIEIHHAAFSNNMLTSIIIPASVKTIGSEAFFYCSELTSINIPNAITTIEDGTFEGCSSLTSITIPNNITSIGDWAFSDCSSLTSISFTGSVKSIGEYAFSNCIELQQFWIGEPQIIGEHAFEGCSNLTTLGIRRGFGDNFSIGTDAFADCDKLSTLNFDLPSAVGLGALLDKLDCSKITKLTVRYTLDNNSCTILRNKLANLEELRLGLIDTIPAFAFQYHRHLKKVYLDNSFASVSIGNQAFDGCTNLSLFSGCVYSLGDFCFMNTNITSIPITSSFWDYYDGEDYWEDDYSTMPEFNHIGLNPFFGVNNFTFGTNFFYGFNRTFKYRNFIVEPDYICSIDGNILYTHASRNSINIPSSVTTLADYAISGSTVKNLGLNNVNQVGEGFLSDCPNLEKITVYSNNTAFTTVDDVLYTKDMTELVKYPAAKKSTELTIPVSVTKIWLHAFQGIEDDTESLHQIYVKSITPPEIGYSTPDFYGFNISVFVPYGSKAAYQADLGWNSFGRIIEYVVNDVNMDGETDVLDVVDIARFVVGTPAETFVKGLADVNSDGQVNIADGVVLVNVIAGDQNFARAFRAPSMATYGEESLMLASNNDNSLSLVLENERAYTAFQFDLYVPEGTDVTKMLLNAQRKQKHQLLYNKVEDGHYRVAALSTSNRTFNGNDGELLNIAFEELPNDNIGIRDIHFFTADGSDYRFDDLMMQSGVSTAIDENLPTCQSADASTSVIYDLQGRRMANDSSIKKGIYVVGGKKVVKK